MLRTHDGSARPQPGTAVTLRSMTCSKPSEQAPADSTSGSKAKAKQVIAVTLRSMTCSTVGQLSTRQEKEKKKKKKEDKQGVSALCMCACALFLAFVVGLALVVSGQEKKRKKADKTDVTRSQRETCICTLSFQELARSSGRRRAANA